jgi:predicted secreted hydrolase
MAPPDEMPQLTGAQGAQLFMAHGAVTTPTGHFSFQRYARGTEAGAPARSGVTAQPFSAWLDDWVLESTGDDWLPLQVRARQDDVGFDLQLQSEQPLVLQGIEGFSRKHENGGGSYYYSQPFLKASGELSIDGQKISVSGNAWLDREWGSQFLQQDQSGWDWFSLHLDSGEKLMLFQLRNQPGKEPASNYIHGVLIDPAGVKTPLNPDLIRLDVMETSVVSGRTLPMKWRIELPQIQRQFIVRALHENQWMQVDFPYWEGVVTVRGDGPVNSGRGYMELTGYSTVPAESH